MQLEGCFNGTKTSYRCFNGNNTNKRYCTCAECAFSMKESEPDNESECAKDVM